MSEAAEVSVFLGMGAMLFFIAVVWYIIQILAYWKIFTKAGEAGWKSIIPFYNLYIQFKLTWNPQFFFVLLVCLILGSWLRSLDSMIAVAGVLLMMAATVVSWIGNFKLAKAFNRGIGFTLGLIFLQPIFLLILGFGDAEYIGPQ